MRKVSLRDGLVLCELREGTAALPVGEAMQVMAEEGQLLALLVPLTGTRTVVEVGTFTGYSTLCVARALPAGGRIVTCDVRAESVDPDAQDRDTAAVRELNDRLRDDHRVDISLLPVADGIALAQEVDAHGMRLSLRTPSRIRRRVCNRTLRTVARRTVNRRLRGKRHGQHQGSAGRRTPVFPRR